MAYSLGIDASTQSVSTLIFDALSKKVIAECSVNFGEDLPHYNAPQGFIPDGEGGEVHSNPLMWLEALDLCLLRLKGKDVDLSKITSISGAGQQHGTVYLNEKGVETFGVLSSGSSLAEQFKGGFSRETSPIWMDTSTSEQCREIESKLGGAIAVCDKSGSIAVERFSGPQIKRFSEVDTPAYEATRRIHLVSSFFSSILSGCDAPIDHGDGAGMNLMNLDKLDWDLDLLEATAPDLREKLPAIVPSQTTVGKISPYFVDKYGINAEAIVVAFTGDNPSSLVGMGGSKAGTVIISLGTSDTFFAAMEQPYTDPKGYGHVFGNPMGGFMTLQCFLNGSLAREKVREKLGLDWDGFSELIDKSEIGSEGKVMLPFFGDEISPKLSAQNPILKGFESEDWASDSLSARACIEGQFLNMKLCSEWMQLTPSVIYLTGGAAQNKSIAQIVANVFQAEVKRLGVASSVALGGAIRSALMNKDLDEVEVDAYFQKALEGDAILPESDAAKVYEKAFVVTKELHESLGV